MSEIVEGMSEEEDFVAVSETWVVCHCSSPQPPSTIAILRNRPRGLYILSLSTAPIVCTHHQTNASSHILYTEIQIVVYSKYSRLNNIITHYKFSARIILWGTSQ